MMGTTAAMRIIWDGPGKTEGEYRRFVDHHLHVATMLQPLPWQSPYHEGIWHLCINGYALQASGLVGLRCRPIKISISVLSHCTPSLPCEQRLTRGRLVWGRVGCRDGDSADLPRARSLEGHLKTRQPGPG